MLAWRWGRPGDRPGDRAPPALCSGQHRASSDTGGSGDGASTPRAGNTRRAARAPRPVQAAPRAQLGRTRPAPSPRALHPVRAAPRYDQRVTHEPVARLRSRCPRFAPAVRKDARSEQPLAHGRQRGGALPYCPERSRLWRAVMHATTAACSSRTARWKARASSNLACMHSSPDGLISVASQAPAPRRPVPLRRCAGARRSVRPGPRAVVAPTPWPTGSACGDGLQHAMGGMLHSKRINIYSREVRVWRIVR